MTIDMSDSGALLLTGGTIDLKNSGSVSNIKFYCESSNAHWTALQSTAHSGYSGNVTLTLPAITDTLVALTATQTLTNKTLTSPKINENVALTSTATELNFNDGVTLGTAIASKVVTTDANIDSTGMRNLTISGEIDAATGDFSGAVDVAGATTTAAITASGIISQWQMTLMI